MHLSIDPNLSAAIIAALIAAVAAFRIWVDSPRRH